MRQDLNISKTVYDTDFLSVRVDKQVLDFFSIKPTSRWDPEFWDPKHDKTLSSLRKYTFKPLGEYIEFSVCGYRGKTEFTKKGIPCIEALCILSSGTGIDVSLGRRVPINGKGDKPNKRTKVNDLLFVRSGVGCAGRTAIVSESSKDCVLGGHIFRVVLKGIEPSVVHIWLKTDFGKNVLNRLKAGVGALVLDEGDIKSILIPEFPETLKKHIDNEYKKVAISHDKAMEANAEGNETKYKKNIEIAGVMLRELIAKTEAVIRGEREDIV